MPPLVSKANPYRLKNSYNIRTIHANTNLYYNSFYPFTMRDWNNLPQEIKESSSVASFKYKLNKDTQRRAPPKIFSVGSRLGKILHARIRMACSSLNSDLYRKNIVPSPSCACGGFESAYHFFFKWPNNNVTRERYLEALLRNHTTHELLFGKDTSTDEENEALFIKVQDYILKSKRFVHWVDIYWHTALLSTSLLYNMIRYSLFTVKQPKDSSCY